MQMRSAGNGLIAGGITGVILFGVAAIFLWKNRLREVETSAFTITGSGQTRIISVGIENWLPLLILSIIFVILSLVLVGIGMNYRNQKPDFYGDEKGNTWR